MPPKQGQQTNIEFLQALNKYIPSLVLTDIVQRTENKTASEQLPRLQKMCTVTLFADISGFTNVSEACAKRGVRGNEELSFVINRYMEGMVKQFSKYGGDIIKFVGDAMIVMWPEDKPQPGQPDDKVARARLTVRKAIQCALDIQKEMDNFQVIQEVSSLSVKIGIGYGDCSLLYVGGVFGRAEFFTVGDALTYALKSEGCCTSGGQIVVSETAFRYVTDVYENKKISCEEDGKFENFHLITKLIGEGIKTRADASQLRSKISPETYNKIAQQLRGCVPAAIIPYLQINAEAFGSETRSLTVMFCSLGIKLSSAETKEGMEKIQKIVTCVQQQVYRHQGSVNKLVMDDKGSTLICLWGLSPLAHDDDAARAILTGINMNRELNKIEETKCKIGISSGEMFSGVVGTSGGRKEFSVLGDVANLAARIMGGGKMGQINTDLNTRTMASPFFAFKYNGHLDFKGKSLSIPVFSPVWPSEEQKDINEKKMDPWVYLKFRVNTMVPERDTYPKIQNYLKQGYSETETVSDFAIEIIEYFSTPSDKPFLAALKGETGSGKTLFARFLIDELMSSEDFTEMIPPKQHAIFCSSLNSETNYYFLNIWRPIMVQLLTQYCKRESSSREQVICDFMLAYDQEQHVYIQAMCNMFNANSKEVIQLCELGPDVKQQGLAMRTHPFVMRENFLERHRTKLYQLVLGFFRLFHTSKNLNIQTPLMIVLDNTQLMDGPSWELLEILSNEFNHIAIVLLQLSEMGELIFNKDAKETQKLVWFSKALENLRLIEVPPLDRLSLQHLLKSFAQNYRDCYYDEIVKMTEMIPAGKVLPDGCKKTAESGEMWQKLLKEKWQINTKFTQVDQHLIDHLLKKCGGNPLLTINYFVQLMQNGYTKTDFSNGMMHPTPKFLECEKLKDYIHVPIPRIALKNNISLIDRYMCMIQDKPNKRPGEFEACVKSVVLLKAATVLGEEFDTKTLHSIMPNSQKESLPNLRKLIKMLEQNNLIEILDETDKDNMICRFQKPFLRESLYQIMLYRDQKNTMHGAAAQYFLKEPGYESIALSKDPPELRAEIRTKQIRQHMLIAQDIENDESLSYEARTGLTVNGILNLIASNPNAIIKKEIIVKQGKGANKNQSDRLITIDTHNFRWYHNEEEYKSGTFLGSVPIQFIYQTVASKLESGNQAAFSISTSQWFDKSRQEQGMRDFYFACPNTYQMDDWMITIEFLRTKAVYDAYAQKNIPVQFPLRSGVNVTKKKEERRDVQSLLYDFGGQLKNRTQLQFANDKSNSKINTTQNSVVPESQLKDTLLKLKTLYNCGIVGLTHHMSQTACKMTVKQNSVVIGILPEIASQKVQDQIGQFLQEPSDLISQKSDISNRETGRRKSRAVGSGVGVSVGVGVGVKLQPERRWSSTTPPEIVVLNQQNIKQEVTQVQSTPNREQLHLVEQATKQSVSILKSSSRSPSTASKQSHQQQLNQVIKEDEILFNQDDKLDNLRSQSPPMYKLMHHDKSSSDYKKHQNNQSNLSSVKEAQDDNTANQSMMQSLQQLIQDQIEQGVSKLAIQNNQHINSQQKELSQLIIQQNQSILSQSMVLHQQSQILDTPPRKVLQSQQSENDLSPLKSFIFEQSRVQGGGITSKFSRRQNMNRHQAKSNQNELSSEPEDPLSEDEDFQKKSYSVSPAKIVPRKQLQKSQSSTPALVNFKDERLYYPPPDRWVDHGLAIFEDPIKPNRVMDLEENPQKDKKSKGPQIARCLRDSYCQRKGFKIPEGTQVQIIETQTKLQMIIVEYKQQQGLFLMKDFTRVIQGIPSSDWRPDMSPVKPAEDPNFFKQVPERQVSTRMQGMSQDQIAKVSQRILDDDNVALKQQNQQMFDKSVAKRLVK